MQLSKTIRLAGMKAKNEEVMDYEKSSSDRNGTFQVLLQFA
jgi:hypothetical protein